MLWLSASPLLLALAASPAPSQPLDARELEAFLDGVIAAQVEAHPIAGATVSVVKEGKLLFAKGYGFADIEASGR
jgi:CubicO group peptidase (beta-lactamase class C family)